MVCDCKSKVDETIQLRLDEAKKIEFEQKKKLEQFQDGIRTGAQSLISRMVYRLGIFMTSLANDCTRNISRESILSTLDQRVSEDPQIRFFYSENRSQVVMQGEVLDPSVILRPLTRRYEKAPGLLQANIKREIESIKKSLERLERLEKSLDIWKEGTRREQTVESIVITDLHY